MVDTVLRFHGRQTNGGYNATLKKASCRLESALTRLRKIPQDLSDYDREIQQLITNQFVEKAVMEYDGHNTNLPHHPVYVRQFSIRAIINSQSSRGSGKISKKENAEHLR